MHLRDVVALRNRGDFAGAVAACEVLLAAMPDDATALTLLGEIHLSQKDPQSAVTCFAKAVAVKPQDGAAWRRLGGACLAGGRFREAVDSFRESLAREPHHARAHNNLGRALLLLGDRRGAKENFERAVHLSPSYGLAHLNLGLLLMAEDPAQALSHVEFCLSCNSLLPAAWCARADCLCRLGQPLLALTSAEHALEIDPRYAAADFSRGRALYDLHRYEESLSCCDRLLALTPDDHAVHLARARVLAALGNSEAAIASYAGALRANPDCQAARWSMAVATIPALLDDNTQLEGSRSAFLAALIELDEHLSKNSYGDPTQMVGVSNPFYLAYQPRNNRDLLGRYGRLCADVMGKWQQSQRLCPRPSRGKLRVGIVSAHIREHSVFNAITSGWLARLDRERFEIHVFHIGHFSDGKTEAARGHSKYFEQGARSVQMWADSIISRRIEVLIYPEIGMSEQIVQLASMRLAPVQCVSWGHPETSGLPTMDYFLSAAAFESAAASSHYTETLVCLPNLGTWFEPLEGVMHEAQEVGSRAVRSAPSLICPGTPFKYLPEHDVVFVEIAKRLGRCRFTFFSYLDGSISRRLLGRLAQAFEQHKLDPSQFLELRPWASAAEFHSLLHGADLMLDTIGFSGFNTVVRALECTVPVVTRRGEFLRGRFGSGILEHISLTELVAQSNDEYVEKVGRLIEDRTLRLSIRQRIADRRMILYRDTRPIEELERFLSQFERAVPYDPANVHSAGGAP